MSLIQITELAGTIAIGFSSMLVATVEVVVEPHTSVTVSCRTASVLTTAVGFEMFATDKVAEPLSTVQA